MRRKRKNQKRQRKAKKDEDIPTEILSQKEIDQILAEIAAGETKTDDCRPVADTRKIRIYDFKRPDKFTREQIRAMCILHEIFARHATFVLTNRFKIPCHIHAASVDQLAYEEYIRAVPAPATLAIIDLNPPMRKQAVIEIDPAVSFAFINRAFGGDGRYIKQPRELTRLEWIVMIDVINKLLESMKDGWAKIIDLIPTVNHTDTRPQFLNIVPPSEMTILITLEANIGKVEGMINICYPFNCLNGVIEKLTAEFQHGSECIPQKKYKPVNRWDTPVGMTAEIFRRDYPIKKVLDWKNEELLLPLHPRTPNTCYLRFDKSRVFRCEILADDKWFPKKIKIIDIAGQSRETEGKMELNAVNPAVAGALAEAGITISVELGRTAKTVNEILKMDVGTIVELDKLAGEPVDIKANGVLIAMGEVVVIDENFGVRVTEIVKASGSLNPSSGAGEGN